MTFDEWQQKHGPNGGAYDIEMQRAGWDGRQTEIATLSAELDGWREQFGCENIIDAVFMVGKLKDEIEHLKTINGELKIGMQSFQESFYRECKKTSELTARISDNDLEQVKLLAFKMGADAFRRRMDDWLNDTFEYENSVTTVHRVRETLLATTAEVGRVI